jgi:hypothetical protein
VYCLEKNLTQTSTEKFIKYEDKGKPSFESSNDHTIWATSNDSSCFSNSDGRRCFPLDVSPEMKGNVNYFNKLYSCFNNEVGSAFYSYLIDNIIIENNFVADAMMPMTNNKKQAIIGNRIHKYM